MEDPIALIEDAGYTNLVEGHVGADAHSYVYDGQAEYLDHRLANSGMPAQVTGLYVANAYRSTDHAPAIVGPRTRVGEGGSPS